MFHVKHCPKKPRFHVQLVKNAFLAHFFFFSAFYAAVFGLLQPFKLLQRCVLSFHPLLCFLFWYIHTQPDTSPCTLLYPLLKYSPNDTLYIDIFSHKWYNYINTITRMFHVKHFYIVFHIYLAKKRSKWQK